MSLRVFTNLNDLKDSGIKFVRVNDLFFNSETVLNNNVIVSTILDKIDKAKYNSEFTFLGRNSKVDGALNKSMLSTGSKTLLNILEHPDICFDVCECGDNALSLLPMITNGNIYWNMPVVAFNGESKCDIICNDKHYNDFYDFLEEVEV